MLVCTRVSYRGRGWLCVYEHRQFYSVRMGKQLFHIDIRYQNLKVIGSGSYGVVCSADDVVIGVATAFTTVDRQTKSCHQEDRRSVPRRGGREVCSGLYREGE